MNCTLCLRPLGPDDGPARHDECFQILDSRLSRIPLLYRGLRAVLEPGRAADTRVSGTRAAPLPLRVEPLSLLCRGGIVSILATWETDWRERRELRVVPSRAGREQLVDGDQVLTDVVMFLRAHLEWAVAEHPAIGEFADEVREIVGSCRGALGLRTDLRRLGRCPAQLGDRTCGRVLYAAPEADEIRCDRCHTVWPRARWLLLGAAMEQPVT